jgi:hypothetical protein
MLSPTWNDFSRRKIVLLTLEFVEPFVGFLLSLNFSFCEILTQLFIHWPARSKMIVAAVIAQVYRYRPGTRSIVVRGLRFDEHILGNLLGEIAFLMGYACSHRTTTFMMQLTAKN